MRQKCISEEVKDFTRKKINPERIWFSYIYVLYVLIFKRWSDHFWRRSISVSASTETSKDSDHIFTNVYKDGDPYINGALKRVSPSSFRATGTGPKTSSPMDPTGSSTKSKPPVWGAGAEPASPPASSTPSCPKSPSNKDLATSSSTPTSPNPAPAKIDKY